MPGRGGGGYYHIKRMGILIGNFQKKPQRGTNILLVGKLGEFDKNWESKRKHIKLGELESLQLGTWHLVSGSVIASSTVDVQ